MPTSLQRVALAVVFAAAAFLAWRHEAGKQSSTQESGSREEEAGRPPPDEGGVALRSRRAERDPLVSGLLEVIGASGVSNPAHASEAEIDRAVSEIREWATGQGIGPDELYGLLSQMAIMERRPEFAFRVASRLDPEGVGRIVQDFVFRCLVMDRAQVGEALDLVRDHGPSREEDLRVLGLNVKLAAKTDPFVFGAWLKDNASTELGAYLLKSLPHDLNDHDFPGGLRREFLNDPESSYPIRYGALWGEAEFAAREGGSAGYRTWADAQLPLLDDPRIAGLIPEHWPIDDVDGAASFISKIDGAAVRKAAWRGLFRGRMSSGEASRIVEMMQHPDMTADVVVEAANVMFAYDELLTLEVLRLNPRVDYIEAVFEEGLSRRADPALLDQIVALEKDPEVAESMRERLPGVQDPATPRW